jgi:hypothetical protein
MRSELHAAALIAMTVTLGSSLGIPDAKHCPIESNVGNIHKRVIKDLGLPDDTLRTNSVSVGFLPSEGDAKSPLYTMAQINERLGAKASTYGWYAQITSPKFDGSQLLAVKEDVIASGAVFVASVMPRIDFNLVTEDVANQVASVMKQFTDAGVTVWLCYAHEMNWYVTDGTYHGIAADFLTSWRNIYNAACKDNAKISCFWSPNQAGSTSDLQPWWPGEEYVDLVGIDCYPKSSQDTSSNELFDHFYRGFYDTYSKPYDLPFAIGETGAGPGQKEQWLKTLVTQEKSRYPNYVSMSWFEFDKETDFRVVMADETTLQQTKCVLLSENQGQCAGSDNGTTTLSSAVPSATSTSPQSETSTSAAQPTNSGAGCEWG